MRHLVLALFCVLLLSSTSEADTFGSGANEFDIEFVDIGNPGNLADTTGEPAPPYSTGKVDYVYRIGKYEVSEDMINKANTLGGLGITKDTRGPDKPATSLSWNEAARFINWLNTSIGSTPAYKFAVQPGDVGYNANTNIEFWTPADAGYNPNNLYRNSLAKYFLPNVDEWYKAAYFDPISEVYYNYPIGRNFPPDGIRYTGDPSFEAVFIDGRLNYDPNNVPIPNDITNVGVLSPYGTAGQGGNVMEWEETAFDLLNDSTSSTRGLRGGHWFNNSYLLLKVYRGSLASTDESINYGFRVASIPEPSTLILLMGAFAFLPRSRLPIFA